MKLCHFQAGLDQPLFLIAGPCVIESEALVLEIAKYLKEVTEAVGIALIFKASFDKANRSSSASFRGPGIEKGLAILDRVRSEVGVPILTDVHTPQQAEQAGKVVDALQTPAFLCRQTDLIQAAAATGKPVNIKKAQFMAPEDMLQVVAKAQEAGGEQIMVCERGSSFGYRNLVVDMRSLALMRETGCPVVFDATHAVQLPGGLGTSSGGQREFVPLLARAAVAAGISGLFMETHPDPKNAKSDGPNAWPLQKMKSLLQTLVSLDRQVKEAGFAEQELIEEER